MHFDRFDIVEAHLAHAMDWHSGLNSKLYEKTGRIKKYYTASPLWRGFESLTDNGQEIYNNLVKRHEQD